MLTASPLPKHILSKSTFMRGCQCDKSLWLYKHRPGLRDEADEAQQSIVTTGTDIGQLARQLFPGGVDATPATPYEYRQSVTDTANYINEGRTVIYEAAFQVEEVLAALDILAFENGNWYGYEVKSTTSVKDQHVKDAALQYWVITSSGIHLKDIHIVHLDNTYEHKHALNVHQLFARQSVLEEVIALQPFIASKMPALKSLAQENEMPKLDIGSHCSDPYPCDFTGYCWKHIPADSVFDLRGRGGSETAFQLYQQGILTIDDIPGD